MKEVGGAIRLAATDLSNHLACRHLTSLDLSVARGERTAPDFEAPDLWVVRERGALHEAAYLAFLDKCGLEILNLANAGDEAQVLGETQRAMRRGVEVIAQGALSHGRWFGRPDVLRRVAKPSQVGNWSYQVAGKDSGMWTGMDVGNPSRRKL